MKTIIIQLENRNSTKNLICKLLEASFYFFKVQGDVLLIEAEEDVEKCIIEIIKEENLVFSFL